MQELIAIDCTNIHYHFFSCGALPALRKLHIEKAKGVSDSSWRQPERKMTIPDLMAHPHLHQISGDESFFTDEIKRVLAGWHKSAFTEQTIECHTTTPHNELTVWTEPGY